MDRRLKKFIALVESGSFSVAAKQLRMTQPAITIAVASLEHSLGCRLIVRNKKNIALTSQGQIVYETALRLQNEIEHMEKLLKNGEIPDSKVRAGIIDSIAYLLLENSRGMVAMSGTELMVDNSERIIRDLNMGRLDFGIVTGQFGSLDRSLIVKELNPEAFIFVRSPSLATSDDRHIDNWLAFNQSSTTYKQFKSMFEQRGLDVKASFYSTSMELLKTMAINGKGIALLPSNFVRNELANHSLVDLKLEPFMRPLWLVSKGGKSLSRSAQRIYSRINSLLEA